MQSSGPYQQVANAALEGLDRHSVKLNKRNVSALAAAMHIPHFHAVGTTVKVQQTADID